MLDYWDGENEKMFYFAIPEALLGCCRHSLPSLISDTEGEDGVLQDIRRGWGQGRK